VTYEFVVWLVGGDEEARRVRNRGPGR